LSLRTRLRRAYCGTPYVYPVTPLGKVRGFAILGIGMFALTTGVLGAAFVEELQSQKNPCRTCPHCGKYVSD
jgi:hypothetical protein